VYRRERQHRSFRLRGYYGLLGQAYLTLLDQAYLILVPVS
jgi:hypothetical protein